MGEGEGGREREWDRKRERARGEKDILYCHQAPPNQKLSVERGQREGGREEIW